MRGLPESRSKTWKREALKKIKSVNSDRGRRWRHRSGHGATVSGEDTTERFDCGLTGGFVLSIAVCLT